MREVYSCIQIIITVKYVNSFWAVKNKHPIPISSKFDCIVVKGKGRVPIAILGLLVYGYSWVGC